MSADQSQIINQGTSNLAITKAAQSLTEGNFVTYKNETIRPKMDRTNSSHDKSHEALQENSTKNEHQPHTFNLSDTMHAVTGNETLGIVLVHAFTDWIFWCNISFVCRSHPLQRKKVCVLWKHQSQWREQLYTKSDTQEAKKKWFWLCYGNMERNVVDMWRNDQN